MADILTDLVEKRHPRSFDEYDRALREVIQEIMLLALWRAKFFEPAAFYGDTSLRILHGLDRFSEDLDFSLLGVLEPTRTFGLRGISMQSIGSSLLLASSQRWNIARGP
jgi:hypothetical protein